MKQIFRLAASNILVRVHKSVFISAVFFQVGYLAQAQSVAPPQPGILADTYHATALKPGQKFDYRLYRGFLLRGVIGSAFGAGIAQWNNTPREWGGGAGAYGKRYASALGVSASRQAFAFGMETAFHQDPRYFPSTSKTFKARLGNVIKQVFVAKNDDGEAVPAYSRLVSAFAAGQLGNAWQPASNNSVGDGLIRGAIIVASDAGVNLATEFIPAFRKRVYKSNTMRP